MRVPGLLQGPRTMPPRTTKAAQTYDSPSRENDVDMWVCRWILKVLIVLPPPPLTLLSRHE